MVRDRFFRAVTVGLLAILYLAPQRANAGAPDSEESSSVSPLNSTLSRARQYLRAGQTEQAERLVRAALASAPDDSLLCLSGESSFAAPARERPAFAAALVPNPENARAHWGLGRIDELHFRGDRARPFARAFSLNHRDIDIISRMRTTSATPQRAPLCCATSPPWPGRSSPSARNVPSPNCGFSSASRAAACAPVPTAPTGCPLRLCPAGAGQAGVRCRFISSGKPLRLLLDTGRAAS
jgi:hypothetical protein